MKKEFIISLIFLLAISLTFSVSSVFAESNSGRGGDSNRESLVGDSLAPSSSNSLEESRQESGLNDSNNRDKDNNSRISNDDSDKNEESNKGSNKDKEREKQESRRILIDEEGREVEIRTKTRVRDGREEFEEKRTFIDENGNRITITIKNETKDGKTETVLKKKITSPNGTEVTFKTKTEIRENREKITNSVEVKGIEVTTKLSIREETRGNQTRLKVQLSTGAEQNITVLPDEAMVIALNELKAGGIIIELSEFVDDNSRKVVFSAKTTKPGKFLGVFNTQIDLETLIDTQTGEIIKTNRPWWAFLIVGQDKADICHVAGNSTKRQTLNVAITSIKAHIEHGDSLGTCVAECGDGILIVEKELCELDDTQECVNANGYIGIKTCNTTCNEFNECISNKFCGDGIVNGNESCDDGNNLGGDGCSSNCEVEISPPVNETNSSSSVL